MKKPERIPGMPVPLAMVRPGNRFRITGIAGRGHGSWGGGRRLMDLGLLPEREGEMLSNDTGRCVICVGGSRIALGRGQSQRVMVRIIR